MSDQTMTRDAWLLGTIKGMQAEIDSLKARVAELEGRGVTPLDFRGTRAPEFQPGVAYWACGHRTTPLPYPCELCRNTPTISAV